MLLMAVANHGVVYRPMLVDKVLATEGDVLEKYNPEVLRTIYLHEDAWRMITTGLVAVTNQSTASSVFKGFTPKIAGKTGSAETGTGTVHSWFFLLCSSGKT